MVTFLLATSRPREYNRVRERVAPELALIDEAMTKPGPAAEMRRLGAEINATQRAMMFGLAIFLLHSLTLIAFQFLADSQVSGEGEDWLKLMFGLSFGFILLAPIFKVITLTDRAIHRQISPISALSLAISVYFGLIYFFAATYSYLLIYGDTPHFRGAQTWSDSVYFSAVTITTLGYGDMVPITAEAKALTSVQAITGVFFVAYSVLVLAVILYQLSNNRLRIIELSEGIADEIQQGVLERVLRRDESFEDPKHYLHLIIKSEVIDRAYRRRAGAQASV